MKFIHVSDIHLGKRPDSEYKWSKTREEEIFKTFDELIDICNWDGIDLLIIAGDLFNKQPLMADLQKINTYFAKLISTKVVIVAGSSDYIAASSNYNNFLWNNNVHMIKDKKVSKIYIEDIDTYIYGYSFCDKHYNEKVCENLEECDTSRTNILVAYGGEEQYVPINFEKLADCKFDYVACGKRHNYEVMYENIVYSGSLEPLESNETGGHGYIKGEIKEHKCSYELIPFSKRQYIDYTINVDASMTDETLALMLNNIMNDNGINNIYNITIEGFRKPDIDFSLDGIFSNYNIMSITDNSLPNYDFQMILEDNSDNLLGMYIENINNTDIDEEVKKKALYMGIESLISR